MHLCVLCLQIQTGLLTFTAFYHCPACWWKKIKKGSSHRLCLTVITELHLWYFFPNKMKGSHSLTKKKKTKTKLTTKSLQACRWWAQEMVSFWRRRHTEMGATSAAAWPCLWGELLSAAKHGTEELAGTPASLCFTIQHCSETRVWQRQSRVWANKSWLATQPTTWDTMLCWQCYPTLCSRSH